MLILLCFLTIEPQVTDKKDQIRIHLQSVFVSKNHLYLIQVSKRYENRALRSYVHSDTGFELANTF